MSKKPEIAEPKVEPKADPIEPKADPVEPKAAPISIMGDPKPQAKSDDSATLKSFTDLKSAFESLEKKIDEFIPKPKAPDAAPEPKAYRLFDEFEVI